MSPLIEHPITACMAVAPKSLVGVWHTLPVAFEDAGVCHG